MLRGEHRFVSANHLTIEDILLQQITFLLELITIYFHKDSYFY